jgi:uncharacterized protein (DUF362 family)
MKIELPDTSISRRDALRRIGGLAGTLAAVTTGAWLPPFSRSHASEPSSRSVLVEAAGPTDNCDIPALTRRLVDAAGGMSRYVSNGDVVVIKPNISWARSPHLGATTHPEVLKTVVELCQEAGAKKVRIADHTIHDARQCFAVTGAAQAAGQTGAELVIPLSNQMRDMRIHGHRLDVWPVFVPFVEADVIINLPIAKVHGISGVTLGMKNWIGAVGGRRSALHQDIHQTIVDLARFFKPRLTIIDATRIMVANGPSGGSESDVSIRNRLIAGEDPVATDALATGLFGMNPTDIGHIRLAEKYGLGTTDLSRTDLRRVRL